MPSVIGPMPTPGRIRCWASTPARAGETAPHRTRTTTTAFAIIIVRAFPMYEAAHRRHCTLLRALVLADLAANRLRRRGLLKHLVKGDLETLSREVGEPVRVDVTNRPPIDRQPFEFLQPPARLEPIQNHPLDPNGESKIRQHLSGPGPGRNDQTVPLVGSAGRSHADTVAPGGPRRHGLVEVEVGPMTAGQIGVRGHTLLGHEESRL